MGDRMAGDGLQRYVERIRAAYPDLAIRSAAALVGHGQNNAIIIVNGNTVFRFPLYSQGVARHFATFLSDPQNRSIRPALIHGDFGPSNVLFDPATNRLSGVIDFDSTHPGDPAIDLAAASCYGLYRLARVYSEAGAALPRVSFYIGTFALQEALFGVENSDEDAFARGIAAYR